MRRRHGIGDVILTTPVVRALRAQDPAGEVHVATDHADVFAGNPDVTRVWGWGRAPGGFDRVLDLDLAYERAPRQHVLAAYGAAAGLDLRPWRLSLYPSPADLAFAGERVAGDRWVVMNTGCAAADWAGRNWLPERWVAVADALAADGWRIAAVGNLANPAVPCAIDLRGRTTFGQLVAVCATAQLFVGADSAPMHCAQAMGTPVVGVFGAVEPAYRLLPDPRFRSAVATRCGCRGCLHVMPAPRWNLTCPRGRQVCMDWLTAAMVLAEVPLALAGAPAEQVA